MFLTKKGRSSFWQIRTPELVCIPGHQKAKLLGNEKHAPFHEHGDESSWNNYPIVLMWGTRRNSDAASGPQIVNRDIMVLIRVGLSECNLYACLYLCGGERLRAGRVLRPAVALWLICLQDSASRAVGNWKHKQEDSSAHHMRGISEKLVEQSVWTTVAFWLPVTRLILETRSSPLFYSCILISFKLLRSLLGWNYTTSIVNL